VSRLRAWARQELPLALEITTLTAFVVARPVLGSFGAAPDVLIAESVDRVDIVLFALVVVLVPPGLALVVGTAVRSTVPRLRDPVHVLAVGGLGALAAWQVVDTTTSIPLVGLALAGAIGGPAVGVVRRRVPSVATFLRFAALAAPVAALQFLVLSPSAALVWSASAAAAENPVEVAPGERPPPVVMVVLDELPTETLLDGTGEIDTSLYPNIGRLAADGTWYRNHTTVSAETPEALGAILTGRHPDPGGAPIASSAPDNLFTLLSRSHRVSGVEQLTAFCPPSLCPVGGGSGVAALVQDAVGLWGRYMARGGSPGIPTRSEDRLAELTGWIDEQDFSAEGTPGLFFFHAVLPHIGWEYLPDGTRYEADELVPGLRPGHVWSDRGTTVGRQRHVLQTQAVDRAVGHLLDRLDAAGTYDDAVVVLMADHGGAFTPGLPRRAPTPETFDQIAWAPLIIKAPGQGSGRTGPDAGGVVNDDNVLNIDVLPTVLDLVGADSQALDLDGRPVDDLGDRDPDEKWIIHVPRSTLSPVDDEGRERLDAAEGLRRVLAADPVPGEGPDAAWQFVPDIDLVGRSLDQVTVTDDGEGPVSDQVDGRFDDLAMGQPLPLEVDVTAELPPGSPVVAAVNGVISGSTVTEPRSDGVSYVQMMLRPDALTSGDNDVRLFVVEGPPSSVELREI
jgi:hypothetical protein